MKYQAMTPTADTPLARLVASRKALVSQMARAAGRPDTDLSNGSDKLDKATIDTTLNTELSGTWQILIQAVRAWWQHHPAHLAVDIGRPFLNKYAQDKPMQLLGIAAGVGAAVVLIKPWRLVSLTGLAVAAFKSTNLSSTLLSMLPRAAPRRNARDAQQPPKVQS